MCKGHYNTEPTFYTKSLQKEIKISLLNFILRHLSVNYLLHYCPQKTKIQVDISIRNGRKKT